MRGFTLVESLVYMALFGIIMSTAFVGAQSLGLSADRLRTQSLLQTEADFLSTKIAGAPEEIKLANTTLTYMTASSTAPISSSAISVSELSHISSTYYLIYFFSLSALTNEGQRISKDFSVLIPTFP